MELKFNYSNAMIKEHEIQGFEKMIEVAHDMLHNKTGLGNEYVGWVDLPVNYDKDEFARIKAAAKKIQEKAEVLIVIGIGGSYLGAKSAIEGLSNVFYNLQDNKKRKGPQIL
ncbi:MAG: glucose-6-phosphate isomerase, partial [Vallitaleaceae bacterium]|nr:glucose-6-phosphate isomerase [Vallitaleaceae bacterium]